MGTPLKIIFMIINWSGIVGGIWLLCLGEWKLVLLALLFLALSKYIIAFLGVFALIFSAPGLLIPKVAKKNKFLGKLLTFLLFPIAMLGHPLSVATYGTLVIHLFYYRYFGQVPTDPLCLLVLGLGTSPWRWFASKEKKETAYAAAFVSELAFFLVTFTLLLQPKLTYVFGMLFVGQFVYSLIALWTNRKVVSKDYTKEKNKKKRRKLTAWEEVKDFIHKVFLVVIISLCFICIVIFGGHLLDANKQGEKEESCDLSSISRRAEAGSPL